MITSKRRVRVLTGLALAVPILALLGPFLFSSRALSGLDFQTSYSAYGAVVREAVARDGELPRWNPGQFAGVPWVGDWECNLYYPLWWLYLAFPAPEALEIFVTTLLLLAVGGMYRLGRHFRLRRDACVLGAWAFALSSALLNFVYEGHQNMLTACASMPLEIFLILRLFKRPDVIHTAALAAGLGALFLGGHPNSIYHVGLMCGAVTLGRLAAGVVRKEPWVRPGAATLLAVLLGAAIAAVHLLPSVEVASWTIRGQGGNYYGDEGIPPRFVLLPLNLVSFLIPVFRWNAPLAEWMDWSMWYEKGLYLGTLPLLVAPIAFFHRRRGPVIFFGAVALLAVMAGMARTFPLHDLLSLLPGFGVFRVPARTALLGVFSLALLSAFGWEALLGEKRSLHRVGWIAAAACAAVVLGIAGTYGAWAEGGLSLGLIALSAVLIAGARRFPRAALAFAAADLCLFGILLLPAVDRGIFSKPPWYAAHIGEERREYRLLDMTDFDCPPIVHGFRLLRGYNYPLLTPFHDFYSRGVMEVTSQTFDPVFQISERVDSEKLNPDLRT